MKSLTSLLIRLVTSALIITFIFSKVDFKHVFATIANCNLILFACAFILFIFTYSLGLWRWQMLLHALELRPPLKKIAIAFFGGLFFNLVMPSTIGGDVARTYSLFSHTPEKGKVVATVVLDRLSGFVALIFISIISLAAGYSLIGSPIIILSTFIIALIFMCVVFVFFSRRASRALSLFFKLCRLYKVEAIWKKVFEALSIFRNKRMIILKNFLVSIIIQGSNIIVFYLVALSLGVKTHILYFFIIIPIIGVISSLPITIGGLGLRDASSILFFSKIGIPSNIAVSLSLISFLFVTIIGLLGGIIYVFTLHTRRL